MFLCLNEAHTLQSPSGQLDSWGQLDMHFYYMGNHMWANMLGQSVKLKPVHIQNLSELERARLQEVALYHLERRSLPFTISIPQETRKRRKSLRKKFDSFSKEKDRETAPQAFAIPLSQVIANDRTHKQRQDALRESRRDCLDLEASVLHFRAEKRQECEGASPSLELHSKPFSASILDSTTRAHRRGGLSVDCISDLVESQSRLLEALQLSHPNELDKRKAAGRTQAKLSLNPIYKQVPRVLERCCRHIHTYGLQTVGIFRVGSSKKRVRQLREEFDLGVDVFLDEEQSVHDVAALLKEFLRDMPDPLLPRELYSAFLHSRALQEEEQLPYLQLLLYILPPCNCDTLLQLLSLLHTVQSQAQDTVSPQGQEITGNKMTAANLAVIFGPNLLQKERDTSPQITGIEDSSTIISVTLMLLQNYKQLFMVSAELQQEVLMSLIQTDPDVIDYLLRRKLSCSHMTVEAESDHRGRDSEVSLSLLENSSEDMSFECPSSPLFPEPDSCSSLSSEIFLSMLCISQKRKCSGDSSGKARLYSSHHNLMSLDQPLEMQGPVVSLQSTGAGEQEDEGDCVWVRQDSLASDDGKGQPSQFWDFFTGKVTGSETVV